jgi:SAM-dependent methyltransferase
MADESHQAGHYENKQLASRIPLLSWSHRSRFDLARRLVAPYAGRRLLDYGCGDATFLSGVSDLFPDATGAGVDPNEIDSCRKRFSGTTRIRFALVADLVSPEHDGAYDIVVCMEVLEHCVAAAVDAVLADLARLVAPSGIVNISVPIEIGPSLIAKQVVRRIAGRRIHDYKFNERYSLGELWRMVKSGDGTIIERPVYSSARRLPRAQGFNWRALRRKIRETLLLQRTMFSPLGLPGGFVSSQAWFICKRSSPER